MPLLIVQLMEEFKIKERESTMSFKTRFDHYRLEEALVCIVEIQNAKFVEGIDGVVVVGPPRREQIQQQVQFILKWDQ